MTLTTRRDFLAGPLRGMTAATNNAVAVQRDVLVCIFQRGGADGLSMVVPHADKNYYAARPELAIPKPAGTPGNGRTAIDLNGFFGLHPSLGALKEIWDARQLAVVHACGSPDPTHSHFDAMDYMERGTPGRKSSSTGWLGRHLALTRTAEDSTLRAVGFGALLQTSLRGSAAVSLQSLDSFRLHSWDSELPRVKRAHGQLYKGAGLLAGAGRQTLASLELMRKVVQSNGGPPYRPSGGAVYPDSPYGRSLMQIAQLIKADVGVQVACADIGDWDTHADQGGVQGELASNLKEFADGVRALYTDLSAYLGRVTIVTMSEFGRRVAENGSGTDHGHGNAMFVLGGNVLGGRVYGSWPGLARDQLYGPGDLQVTTDFRDVIGEVVAKRLRNPAVGEVFPGYDTPRFRGLVRG